MKAGMKKCISYLLTAVFVISAAVTAGGLQKKQVRAAEKFYRCGRRGWSAASIWGRKQCGVCHDRHRG